MKHVIIGTAGHVDHGKTTLIRALTGTDTDRLKEEQERGMTIDLGFAALTLPDGTPAGIVDVPGHERFLKNMLAGAGGVDVVLLVIAADESVMPQTVEHLDILRLLDVRNGVVALTKCDLVDADWLPVVEDDIRARLQGTFLAASPIVRVDSIGGKGVPELKKVLLAAVSRTEAKNSGVPFRLPVDRVFTRPGFGPVVTGTLVAGTMRVGDAVMALPMELACRVRGLQTHNKKQETVEAGTRVAVNLAGIEAEALERGVLLVPPGTLAPTQMFDARLRMLDTAARPLANRARVRVYHGTAEILGRVVVLGAEQIAPGEQGFVQFRAESPFACARGDRFVVRTYSPMATIAGGVVLDSAPGRHRRMDVAVTAALVATERGSPADLVDTWLKSMPYGALARDAAAGTGLGADDVTAAISALVDRGDAIELDGDRLVHRTALRTATDRAVNALSSYHTAQPLKPGMPREELRGSLGKSCDPRAFASLVRRWHRDGPIVLDQATVRLADFVVKMNDRQQALLDRVLAAYEEAGFQTPTVPEVCAEVGAPPDAVEAMVRVALDRGLLARIADGLYYHRATLERTQEVVRGHVLEHGSITASQFRDLTGSSRKYAVPVLEYLDAIRFTRRVGDERVLGPAATPVD